MIGKHRIHLQVLSSGHWSQTHEWLHYLQLVCLCVYIPLLLFWWLKWIEMGSSAYERGWVSTTMVTMVQFHVTRVEDHTFRPDPVVPFYAAKTARRSGKTTWANLWHFRQAKVCGFATNCNVSDTLLLKAGWSLLYILSYFLSHNITYWYFKERAGRPTSY